MPQPNRPDPSPLPPIARRRCPSCGLQLFLSRIEPTDRVDYEEQTMNVRLWGNSGGQIPLAVVEYQGHPNRRGSGMRAIFGPATPYSDSIVRPSCSECGTATLLVGIEPDGPGHELHTFQCPRCEKTCRRESRLMSAPTDRAQIPLFDRRLCAD
jgi:hypothetical protein